MTLHIYSGGAAEAKLLIGLEFGCLAKLEPVFQEFRRSTGVRLSEYDDAVLGPQHVALLYRLLTQVDLGDGGRDLDIVQFKAVLRAAVEANGELKFVGE